MRGGLINIVMRARVGIASEPVRRKDVIDPLRGGVEFDRLLLLHCSGCCCFGICSRLANLTMVYVGKVRRLE